MPKDNTFNLKDAIDFLLKSFKTERYIYLTVTILSIVLMGFLTFILFKQKDYTSILAMLGPTGLITFFVFKGFKNVDRLYRLS